MRGPAGVLTAATRLSIRTAPLTTSVMPLQLGDLRVLSTRIVYACCTVVPYVRRDDKTPLSNRSTVGLEP
jgi:hypothetical protein